MKKSIRIFLILSIISQLATAQSLLKNIAQKADNAVFTIIAYNKAGAEIDRGCGFFIDTTGRAIGRAHIFRNAYKAIAVLDDGRKLKVKKVVAMDYISNTALFNIKKDKKGYEFFKDEYVSPVNNEEVMILKNVDKKNSKIDLGNLKRIVYIEGFGDLTELEQNIEKSNDGCPVINREGKLIGIASKMSGNKMNYSVNYEGLSLRNKTLIDFAGDKRLPGNKKTKFPPLRAFTPVYESILQGNYNSALDELQKHLSNSYSAITDNQDKRAVLFLKAFIEKKLGQFENAKETYTNILEIKVDDELAFLERAKLKIKLGEINSAGKDLEESLGSTSENKASLKKLQGDVYSKLGDFRKAEKLYLEAQNMGYAKYDLFEQRSKIAIKSGTFDKARDLINQAIEVNPYDARLYVLRGEINAELGNADEATSDFEQSDNIGYPNIESLKIMARAKIKIEDYEGAIKTLEQAYKLNKDDPELLLLRGQSFNIIRSFEEAKTNLDKLIRFDAFNSEAYYHRGKTHLALRMMDESLADFTKAIRLNPNYTEAFLDRGVAFGLIGNFETAIKDFEKVVELDTESAEGHYNLGLAQFQLKNLPKACESWNKSKNLGFDDSKQYINQYCGNVMLTDK